MQTDILEKTGNVTVTDSAAETVKNLLISKNVPDYGLRVFVSGGGCSGLQYGMALEAESKPYDHVIDKEGYKIFIDPTSMMYMDGCTIDYVDAIMGGGFKIDNPNAVASCGCGTSFKAKDSAGAASDATVESCGSCAHG